MGNDHLQDRFISLIRENEGILHKVCNIYARRKEEKEDLKQEIILQLWKSYSSFRGDARFQTWMYRVALNTALYYYKKRPPEGMDISELQRSEETLFPELEERLSLLYQAIRKLHQIDRAIILLYFEKKTYREIGEIMGISEKNVSVRLVRIKEKLKQLMTNS